MTSRPSWDEYFSNIATLASHRSPCERLHVGCVYVKDNHIISMGYNGFIAGLPHHSIVRDGHEVATIHAEQNAICDASRRGVSLDKCVAYITHYPCLTCYKLMVASGITSIKYIDDYNNDDVIATLSKDTGVYCVRTSPSSTPLQQSK